MAMGGHHKGNNGNRGRPYALMLLLAFGAALFGVMVVQKFREKRIFNLLIKEKDSDILSLQLLLQKERDQTHELKKKTDVMRVKIYSLRSQKMELDNTIREMQSTMSSLRDEQKMLESALEENQMEIKMLREKDSGRNDSQEAYLDGMLKKKEATVEELNRQLKRFVKLGYGQTTVPSSYQQVNSTSASSEKQESKSDIMDIEKSNMLSNSTKISNGGDQSGNTAVEDGRKSKTKESAEKVVNVINSTASTLVLQKQGSSSDENPMDDGTADQGNVAKAQEANNDGSQEVQRSVVEDDGKNPNGENILLDDGNISRHKEGNGNVQTMGTEDVRRKNLEEDEKVESGNSEAGLGKLKLEPSDISFNDGSSSSSTAKRMVASAGKKPRKKRRVVARHRKVEHKATSETNDALFAKDRKSSRDATETENREVAEVTLHEVTARSRYHDRSRFSKANNSDQTEDGMRENSKPVDQDDPIKRDSDQSEFESKSASDKMNVESSTKSKEDTTEDDEPSDSAEGELLEFTTPKRTEDLKGSATDVQQDQKEKEDITLEKSTEPEKAELPITGRFSRNLEDKLTGEVKKQDVEVGLRQGGEQEANSIQDERNEAEETYG